MARNIQMDLGVCSSAFVLVALELAENLGLSDQANVARWRRDPPNLALECGYA